MYFSDAMAYNQQYVLAAQMQHAGQVVQQQQQTIAEQQHQAAAALELAAGNAAAASASASPAAAAATPAPNPNAMAIRRPFDPTAHELDANFRLTRFADLKG